jgi:hypothetical protein
MTWLDPPTAVCDPWPLSMDCCKYTGNADEDTVAESVLWASNELWWATGQRIGSCVSTVHYCQPWVWNTPCLDCPPYDLIDLGPQIVTLVSSVTVNGTALAKDDDWVVLDWRWLGKVSGSWPISGTVITFTSGEPPNPSAIRAGEVLACEDLRRKTGDKNCRLSRERSSRRDGRFEIPEVDGWVSLQNRQDDCGIVAPEKVGMFYQVTSGS